MPWLYCTQYPHAIGVGRHNVLRHLREHVLAPTVRMASIVRSLITLAETLRSTLHQIDDDTGDVVVDVRNTELYLKVIAQIHAVYKTDASKALFSPHLQQPAHPTGSASSSSTQPPAVPSGPQGR
jgi:hypothetical protein